MSKGWSGTKIDWKNAQTWVPTLSHWLRPYLISPRIRGLRSMGFQDHCQDDSIWLKIVQTVLGEYVDWVIEDLAFELEDARILTYHGCRVKDAGSYIAQGIRRNNPEELAELARQIVRDEADFAWMRDSIDDKLNNFRPWDRDTGKLYLSADDRNLINSAGHYLLYGSEWIQCVLGESARSVLCQRGIPTIISVDLPLKEQHENVRIELARWMLHEWTRIKINAPETVQEIDFSFILDRDVPPNWIVSHYHPETVPDPFYQNIETRSLTTTCPACLGEN